MKIILIHGIHAKEGYHNMIKSFMRKLGLTLLLVSSNSFAGPYIELGIGAKFGECDCSRFDNPIGIIAAGYQIEGTGLHFEIEHRSSLVQKDYGQNLISVRYRWEFKD